MNKPNQKTKSSASSPSQTQKPAATLAVTQALKPVEISTIGQPVIETPEKIAEAPMHAAKGNDDTMSQPQAGKTQLGKKTS